MSKYKEMPETMDLRSLDISAENRAGLKALFPTVFIETRNDKGEPVEAIDFEKLKAELGTFSAVYEARRERYGMDWPGKKDCMKLIQQPSVATLKPCREESVNFDTTGNLFIEGDNLEVLKLLQKSYYGKVKMIYIDPPYNTGKEFIYPDKYAETLETYLAYAGLIDDEGKKFSTNTPNEGRFHTRWLNMMYPRLYLARNLLREDGVIFISIDDNEVSNLRKICDEIFGEENFLGCISWQKKYAPANDKADFSASHDFIIVFAKARPIGKDGKIRSILFKESRTEEMDQAYKNPDNDPRGPWKSGDYTCNKTADQRPNLFYPISQPILNTGVWPKRSRVWAYSKEEHERNVLDNRIWWGNEGKNEVPAYKRFLSEVDGVVAQTVWTWEEAGHTDGAKKELKELFVEAAEAFETPKPTKLIGKMIELATINKGDDIVLDFFSGTSTTAHAVLGLNKEDNGNRKFIMIQLPEPCDKNSGVSKAGYKTIADISKERIRRVIKKIKEENETKEKEALGTLPGMDEKIPIIDLGFKVLKLDRSNFKIWDGAKPDASEEDMIKQLTMHIDHINPHASQEDILYELLLKAGFMPTEKVVNLDMAGKTVFSVSDGALLICLEEEITRELIDAVAAAEPMQFICLDKGFQGNDQLKANAVQTFNARNQGRDKAEQIVFRTV